MKITNAEDFNVILAKEIYEALEPGEQREVGFEEVAGTLGDFAVAAVNQGLAIYATTANSITLRKPSSAPARDEKSAKYGLLSYEDLLDENEELRKQLASLRRQLKSYQDATYSLMALINANKEA